MTITEALAEIKTVGKRLASKKAFVEQYLYRPDSLKDPLEATGGSYVLITREMQAIADLEQRIIDIRRAIAKANEETKITIEGVEKSIADWLIWRREVAPDKERFLNGLNLRLTSARDQIKRQSPMYGTNTTAEKPVDLIVNVSELELKNDREEIKTVLGNLDGQLSLKNATVAVTI